MSKRYFDHCRSVRYDRKEYVESLSKMRVLQISESVTVKMKSHVWKAMVVDSELSAATNSASQSSRKRQAETSVSGRCKRSKSGGV